VNMSVQDVLLQQAMLDSQNKPDPAVAMGVGATGGALLGALAGAPLNATGMLVNRVVGKSPRGLRPGFRMAGGLVGAIAGGGLGAGLANMMKQSSPAGNMLATIQAKGGQLNTVDQMRLESILKDIYGNM
jgi:hypothetical protein